MALTPQEIDGLRELIADIYGPVTEELLRDLCRCIAAAGQVTSSAAYKLLLAKSLPADSAIAQALQRQTALTNDAVEQLLLGGGKDRAAGGERKPAEHCQSLREGDAQRGGHVLGELAAADVDGRVYPIKDVYRRTMDYVFRQVSSGAKTPEEACGGPRCGCGSAAYAPLNARTGAALR
ncbi:MAG: hypothetical protein ACLRWF_01750 [Ruthenibacterium sp.]